MGSSLEERRGPTGERPPVRMRLVRARLVRARLVRLSVLGPCTGSGLGLRRLVRLRRGLWRRRLRG